ncbi:uncharacterized protein At4g15970-like [Musa acuminata AAA Group]|uniref:uncharacterized protein At4g15970-like n=1 Tax=Musa acuminata AAA Group TaxID=214697 RepID=UPI0031D40AD8
MALSDSATNSREMRSRAVRRLAMILVLVAVVVPGALLYGILIPSYLRGRDSSPILDVAVETVEPADQLEMILRAADMGNKTVIMTTLNDAWTEPGSVLDLFLESFRIGNGTSQLLNHLVFITMGQKAHERCTSMRGHCFDLNTKGANLSEQKDYNTPGYLDITWQRLDFQRQVLEKGYDFIFTDTDILWLRNPLPHFYPQGDFQVSCDRFFGNATDLENWPSNGFNYVRSNNRTISFFKYWYSARKKYPQDHDQAVFNYIKHDAYLRELGLTIRFLDSKYFHGLCEIRSRDWDAVCTMHANCRIGLSSKLSELRGMLEEWKKYISGNHS